MSLKTIRALLEYHAQASPDAPFLIDPKTATSIGYADALSQVQNVARYLAAQGLQAGDAVAYASNNSPQAALCILGILYGGYLATSVNLVAGNTTIDYVLQHSGSRLILCDGFARELLAESAKTLNIPLHDQATIPQDTSAVPPSTLPSAPSENHAGILMYTSGTTGRPKGVLLSQRSLVAGGRNVAQGHGLSAQDCGLCVLPLYHINGLCVTLFGSLYSGSSLVVPPKFSVSDFWQMIGNHACTWFSVVPTQISYLLHQPEDTSHSFPHLRFGRSASAPLAPEVQNAFEQRFNIPIIETMGLTETAAQILSNPLPPAPRKIGSPGIAMGNEVMIARSDLSPAAVGEEGEVLVRGDNVMMGYLNNAEATDAALTADGWLRTGDLGRCDADGYFTITGRLKELIIKGGENIAPKEVDEALYTHPQVIEAAAFPTPCKQYGQQVEAAVSLDADADVTPQTLIDLCKEHIGAFKSPCAIHILPELPKGPSGKIQRRKLAEMFDPTQT